MLCNDSTSTRLFAPNLVSSKMNQTNVSSCLTATYKKAAVFKKGENQRVCCTRIRCGIATYACNEGNMDSAFFAKHFMKNKEATTDLHYNLKSNRRHAIHIAMNLYNSFRGYDVTNIHEMSQSICDVVKNASSEAIIEWLKKNDPSICTQEIDKMKESLSELQSKSCERFYGSEQVIYWFYQDFKYS